MATCELLSAIGDVVSRTQQPVAAGSNQLLTDTAGLAPSVYILRVSLVDETHDIRFAK